MDKPNVLLIYMDCLRRDHVQFMPNLLKQVSKSGWTEFANHRTVAHCSDPNFLSIFTGDMPDSTGVFTQMGAAFNKTFPTLQMLFRYHGWRTWAYEPIRTAKFYRAGFEDVLLHETSDVSPVLGPGIRKVIESYGTDPWFGFMRIMDTHYPYIGEQLPTSPDGLRSQYKKAVQHLDQFVPKLLKYIQKQHPNTVIVVGSDHGEQMGDRGLWDHLFTLTETLVRVPLFIFVPDTQSKVYSGWTQHTIIANILRTAAGIQDIDPFWSFLNDQMNSWDLPVTDAMFYTAWGCAKWEGWKHRAVSLLTKSHEYKYTMNWSIEGDMLVELHIDGDEGKNFFGPNEASAEMVSMMANHFPNAPVPALALQKESTWTDTLFGFKVFGKDGMND